MKLRVTNIPFTRLIIGFLFLANPMPLLLDILPDFIGYLLILSAIAVPADGLPYFDDARKGLKNLIWISASKYLVFILMMSIYGGDTTQRSIVPVFTLPYAVLEAVFLIPVLKDLFDGFYYLGERFNVSAAIRLPEGSRRRISPEKIYPLTVAFFIVRQVMSTLPEFTLVPVYSPETYHRFNINLLYPFCAVAGAIVVIVFAVCWCVQLFSYLRRIEHDEHLPSVMETYCRENEDVLTRKYTFRTIKTASAFLLLAVVTSIDLIFDHYNYLPDIISALAFFAASLSLLGLTRRSLPLLVSSLIYIVFCTVSWGMTVSFFDEYSFESITRSPAAQSAYNRVMLLSGIQEFFAVLTILATMLPLFHIIAHYVGVERDDLPHHSVAAYLRRRHRIKVAFFAAIGIFAAAASLFYTYSLTVVKYVGSDASVQGGTIIVPLYDWAWMPAFFLGVIWCFLAFSLFSSLQEDTEQKLIEQ